MEEWRDIKNFDGYQASNEGKVKSLNYNHTKKERILKSEKDKDGYLQVVLYKNGIPVMKKVHRLVAQAFLENPQNLPQVNHKDECKTNNSVDNLEFCDNKYNVNYGTRNQRSGEKLTNHPTKSKRVDQIDPQTGEVIRQWESTREAGRNGFKQNHVSDCARGKYKQYKGFIWKYIQ